MSSPQKMPLIMMRHFFIEIIKIKEVILPSYDAAFDF